MRVLRELSRRKLRTSLTVIGITIGIWALVVFSSMASQMNSLVGMGSDFYADKDEAGGAGFVQERRFRRIIDKIVS